jgi:hypothetical protein
MNKEQFELKNEELRTEWFKLLTPEDKGFIWDGIIDYEKWINYDLKLAFILKEAYSGHNEPSWNIAQAYAEDDGLFYVGNNANQSTHYRIVEWAYAIDAALHGRKLGTREEAKSNNYSACREVMLASAYINLKKIDGKSSSNDQNLITILKRDKDLLNKQLDLIKPNILLFGSTFTNISKDILFADAVKIQGTTRCYDNDGILLIDFLHPTRCYTQSFDDLYAEVSKIEDKTKYLK